MTILSESIEKAQVWSLLSKTPVLVHNTKHDAYIVYWNGIAMTKNYALMLVAQKWMNMLVSSGVKKAAWDEFNRVYRLGAFGHHDWDDILDHQSEFTMVNYYANLLCRDDRQFLSDLADKYSAKEALEWFDPVNQQTITEHIYEV